MPASSRRVVTEDWNTLVASVNRGEAAAYAWTACNTGARESRTPCLEGSPRVDTTPRSKHAPADAAPCDDGRHPWLRPRRTADLPGMVGHLFTTEQAIPGLTTQRQGCWAR